MNEAALLAVRRKHRFITMEDCDEAILKAEMGPEKKSRKMSDKAKRLTAYHESGHAITSKFLQHTDPVHYITIFRAEWPAGLRFYRPDEDTEDFTSKAQMFERIVSCLGGRIAEKLFLDDISTGASGDIQQATSIARNMVTRYGMSEKLGPIQYDSSDHSIFIGRDFGQTKSYSEETAALIDEEVKRIFDEASVLCEKILTEHRDTLIGVAEYLLENESMDRDTSIITASTARSPSRSRLLQCRMIRSNARRARSPVLTILPRRMPQPVWPTSRMTAINTKQVKKSLPTGRDFLIHSNLQQLFFTELCEEFEGHRPYDPGQRG